MAYTDDWESLMNGVFGPGAVSYTHLDVYKRQHLAFPGHGDGKGITGGVLLDQGAKVVLLGDLSAVDAHDAVTGCLLYTSRCV